MLAAQIKVFVMELWPKSACTRFAESPCSMNRDAAACRRECKPNRGLVRSVVRPAAN
jgi:hypothetical protein